MGFGGLAYSCSNLVNTFLIQAFVEISVERFPGTRKFYPGKFTAVLLKLH